MVIKNVNLETVCGITSTLPDNALPEIAFAGKSNVGKSSLINALMNRKSLARTSAQPGKTQTINFYNVNDAFYLVDLPGYGYAKVSEEVKAKWGKMVERYLKRSKQLRAVQPIIIATKMDKLNRSQIPAAVKAVREGLNAKAGTTVIPFSSLSKQGREEIYEEMDRLLAWQEG